MPNKPWISLESGQQISHGYIAGGKYYDAYKAMVNAELVRQPTANITATYSRVLDHIVASVTVENLSGMDLSATNQGLYYGILVYEDIKVGLTNRYARLQMGKQIKSLANGAIGTYPLDSSNYANGDLVGVNWDKLHVIAYAEYNPTYNNLDPSQITTPWDMLQAAYATEVPNISLRQSSINLTVNQLSTTTHQPANMTATIDTAGGPSGMTWTVAGGLPDWLTVTPTGLINSAAQVNVIGSKLQAGLNTATVSFSINQGGTTKTVTIPVNVTYPSPQYTVSPGSLENLLPNQDLPSGKVATLQMTGNFVNMPWEVFAKPAWVQMPASGVVGTSVDVSIDPNAIQATSNSGTIVLKSYTANETVFKEVKISYDPPDPVLDVQPQSIILFNDPANPKDQVRTVTINGSPTTSYWSNWTASSDVNWMTALSPGSVGSSMTLFVNSSKLQKGTNIGHITITATKYNLTVTKTVTVTVNNQTGQGLYLPIILR